MRLIIFLFSLVFGIVVCQTNRYNQDPYRLSAFNKPGQFPSSQFGRFEPLRTTTKRPYNRFNPVSTFGSSSSGQYRPNIGQYKPTVSPYRPTVSPYTPNKSAQSNSGRYQPENPGRYKPSSDGKYTPVSDGKYNPTSDGKYTYTDAQGRYKDSGHGKYINGKYVDGPYVDGKYVGDTSGFYVDSSVGYNHQDVGGGQYSGKNEPYVPYKDKQYPGGAYQGDNSGGKYQGSSPPYQSNTGKTSSNLGSPSGSYTRPSNVGSGIAAFDPKYVDAQGKSTLGVPQDLEKGNAAGLYDKQNYGIVVHNHDRNLNGDYHYMYETENKIFGEEFSKVVSDKEEKKHGYYKYTGPDSIVYTVTYNAGVEGFVPEAKHIPKEPPIPELIQRALDYKRAVGLI